MKDKSENNKSEKNKSIIKNLSVKKAAITMAVAGTLTVLLTGCNQQIIDTKMTYNKAIIFDDNSATIVDIEKWTDYADGEQFQLKTSEGLYILTSAYDTKLIDDRKSDISAEDFARRIVGEDGEINYLSQSDEAKQKTK